MAVLGVGDAKLYRRVFVMDDSVAVCKTVSDNSSQSPYDLPVWLNMYLLCQTLFSFQNSAFVQNQNYNSLIEKLWNEGNNIFK